MKASERYIGYDVIRTLAIILVPFIHSFQYITVLDRNLLSVKWVIYVALHYVSYICVPLFMMLSGALMSKKEPNVRYYAGLVKILVPYILISVITIIFKNVSGASNYGVLSGALAILNFSAVDYAWYVEMYIGLYLIIPFLNIIIERISKKTYELLIGILVFITFLPSFLKGISGYLDIIPDFWQNLYPLTYYFIGAYFARYKPKVKKACSLIGLAAAVLIPTVINFIYTKETGEYAWFVMSGYNCLTTGAIAVFTWLLAGDIESLPKSITAVFTRISLCSFEMYLISYIWDTVLYPHAAALSEHTARLGLPIFFIMSALVFIVSFVSALALRIISVPFSRLIFGLFEKLLTKRNLCVKIPK